MATWKNLDTLASYSTLNGLKDHVNIAEAMSGDLHGIGSVAPASAGDPASSHRGTALAAGALIAEWAAFIGSGVFLPTVLTADHVGVPTGRCFLGRHNLESLLKQENGRKAYAGSAFILQGIPRSVNGKRRNNRKFTNFPLIFPSPHPTCRRVPPTRMPP